MTICGAVQALGCRTSGLQCEAFRMSAQQHAASGTRKQQASMQCCREPPVFLALVVLGAGGMSQEPSQEHVGPDRPSRLLMQRCCYHLEVATGRQRRCIWRCVMLEHDQSLPAARESRWRQLCCRRAAPELATIIATMRCRVEHARGAQRLRGKRGREVKGGGAEGSEAARSVITRGSANNNATDDEDARSRGRPCGHVVLVSRAQTIIV